MHIQLDPEYKKLCYIKSIKPGHLRVSTILICILLTILTAGIPLILYWKWQKFRNFIHLLIFGKVQSDSPDVSHYLIVDSYKFQGKSRKAIYRTQIVSPYLVQEEKDERANGVNQKAKSKILCKYIEHKNLRYVIQNNTLHSIKFKLNKNLVEYIDQGLSSEQMEHSINFYGKADSFSISFFHILRKILHQKYLRFVFMMFAIKKIVFGFLSHDNQSSQVNEKVVSITILAEIVLTWLMMIGISIFGAKQHNKVHAKIQNQTFYKVIRKRNQIDVKPNELCVGDVVIPKKGQIIYFKGILAASIDQSGYVPYVIVNEKLYNRKDNAVHKIPIQSNLIQVQQINTINPGSQILNMGFSKFKSNVRGTNLLSGMKSNINIETTQYDRNEYEQATQQINVSAKFYIIVTDNNIMRFMKAIEKSAISITLIQFVTNMTYNKLVFMHFSYFYIHFQLIFSVLGTILVSIDEKTHQHWLSLLLSNIVLCFPFNLGLFCNLSEIISIIRLKTKDITVVNPMIEEIGITNNLSMELSTFETLQYRGFIKKQRCNGFPAPDAYQNRENLFQAYRRTKEDSVYAFLGWIGLYNRPYFDTQPIYKEMFESYGFSEREDQYNDNEDQNPRIINSYSHLISIDWQEMERYSISDLMVETLVIKNHRPDKKEKRFITISEGEYTSEDSFFNFDQLIDERGTDPFKDVMQRLHSQGKKIKYICSKKLLVREDENWPHFKRQDVEKKSEFMGLLVFDEWPSRENMRNMLELDSLQLDGQDNNLSIKLFSIRQQNALIGYDHILRYTNIFHSMQSSARAEQTYMTKANYQGGIHIGNGMLDQGSLLMADISVNKMSQSYGQADFLIHEPKEILSLFHEGLWALYNNTLTVVCLVLFNFSKIVGQLVLFEGDKFDKLEAAPMSANYDKLFILDFGALIVPLFLLNLYEPTKKLVRKDHSNFFRVELMYHAFISLVGLAVLYTIEFIDHGFNETCQIYENGLKSRNLLELRSNEHNFLIKLNEHSCEGIVDFITVSFAFLTIVLVDRQTSERKPRNIVVRMLNKIYMFLLWVFTIILFAIPLKNVIRALIVMLILVMIVFASDFMTSKTKFCQSDENSEEIGMSLEEREEQEERQRARRRMR